MPFSHLFCSFSLEFHRLHHSESFPLRSFNISFVCCCLSHFCYFFHSSFFISVFSFFYFLSFRCLYPVAHLSSFTSLPHLHIIILHRKHSRYVFEFLRYCNFRIVIPGKSQEYRRGGFSFKTIKATALYWLNFRYYLIIQIQPRITNYFVSMNYGTNL